jgi:hypothetical protein
MTIIKNDFEVFFSDIKKTGKWHYRVKSWVILNKGQFTHICQLWPRFRERNSTLDALHVPFRFHQSYHRIINYTKYF